MTQPYFIPDPNIEDADLLGYGDLLFDNGTTKYLSGDADLAAGLPRQNVDQGPAPDLMQQMQPQPIGGTNLSVDPSTGNIMSSNANDVSQYLSDTQRQPPPPPESHVAPMTGQSRREQDLMGQMDQMSGTSALAPQPIPGTQMQVDPSTGNISPLGGQQAPGGATSPQYGYGAGGLQPVQREGALPPEIAAQQASQRETANTNEMLALASSREAEANVYRQAALKRQGELDAERAAQQKAIDEQQAKAERWQQEQRDTAAMDIKTDLVSAEGAIGSVFSILGAAVLGAVGSDAGLRMIDNTINTNVNRQISMRDSKLKILAEQLGSTQQAIAAGKATLYRIAADRAETMQQITKADAFEAQTPEILSRLRQKQQLYEQEQQRISLGKTLEKAPAGLAPPKPIDVEKYGKLAAEQAQQEKNIQRAANAIGLTGYDPKTGKFSNREEILKNGIPGVGKLDSFLQGVPGLRNIDNAATSVEGQKVRAALEGLVAAEAKAQNPGRAPTDADRDAARITLGLNTEEGTIAAVERLMGQQEQYKAQNTAAFGNAAATYEGRIDAQGARPPQANGPVDTGRPLEPGQARQMLEQERQRMRPREGLDPAVQEATGQAGSQASANPIQEVAAEVQTVAGRELPPEGLQILVAQAEHETGDGKHAPNNNMFGHKASGGRQGAELMTTEGEGANARRVKQTFAVYPTVAESVTEHVDLLKRRYPDAWKALERGDAPAYVAALKDGGYFTGSETEYLNGIQRRL